MTRKMTAAIQTFKFLERLTGNIITEQFKVVKNIVSVFVNTNTADK